MEPRHRSPSSGVALAALSAVAATALLRVFSGSAWLIGALGATAGPHLIDARTRRRSAWITALSMAAGAGYCMVVVDPGTTYLGVPTSATLASFARRIADAPHVLSSAVLPVAPAGSAMLLALLAAWTASSIAIHLDRSPERSLAAVTPSLVLFVAVIALGSGAYATVTVAYAAAVGAYLLARSMEHLAGSHSWFSGEGRTRGFRRLAVAGLGAGTLAVALGAVLGPVLPGATGVALLDYRDLGSGRGRSRWQTISPLVDIRGRLLQSPAAEMFTVQADRAAYWRLVALDRFDGSAWVLGETGAPPTGDTLPTGDAGAVGSVVRQHFRIGSLASRWLPAAYRPTEIEMADAHVIEEVLALVSSDDLDNGVEYEVLSQVATPTAADLAQSAPIRGTHWSRYLDLPESFPKRVVDLAERVVDTADTPYEKALALQTWLRDPERFTYTLDAAGGHGSSAIEAFLFATRRGYCEQFAGSFAAMARAVGLPARVAVGFTPGALDPEAGVYRVTSQDAHAWPEVYLSGIGWTAFEPTPGRFEPTPGDPTGTQAERRASSPPATAPGAGSPVRTSEPSAMPPSLAGSEHSPDMEIDTGVRPDRGSWTVPVLVGTAIALAVVLAAMLVYTATVSAIVALRTLRRRHAHTNRDLVMGAWDEAIDRLADAGIERRPSSTAVEFALRHAPAHGAGEAGPPLMGLARLHTAAVFSPSEPGDDDATAAWEHVAHLVAALRASTRSGLRLRHRLHPRRARDVRT